VRDVRNRLQDILDAIDQIQAEAVKGRAVFDDSSLIQVWMVHHLMIIGEAARAIDPAVRRRYPSVPWRQITGMRNLLVHDYFRINQEIVWETVEKHLPALKIEVKRILEALPNG
jgi:uncharacterized protein with HEPN domain